VDIKPVMGAALWLDILTNQHTDPNSLLIAGGTYTNPDGHLVTFQGLKAALACYTYARYILAKNAVDTPFGMVSKVTEYSTPVSQEQLVSIASEKRNEANLYLRECTTYLDDNSTQFPLWLDGCGKNRQPKFIHRITPVTRFP
jgi:hypothetical protein